MPSSFGYHSQSNKKHEQLKVFLFFFLAKLRNIYNPKALYIIKRCQDVGLAQEKRPAGADLKHVRRAQSPKQMVHYKKQ